MSTTADPPPMRTLPGALLIFRFSEIPVFLHWSWGLVLLVVIAYRSSQYSNVLFPALEYIGLFAIVLLHEFGHALACRSVGGSVSHVLLWPLGGVAHVRPPQRPWPVLWSIAAGPLVNLVLAPIALSLWVVVPEGFVDSRNILLTVAALNLGLFLFNMLPIYPLDGGQIVRALLWFFVGREWSLVVTAGMGLVVSLGGAAALLALAASRGFTPDVWLLLVAGYAAWQSWRGLRAALTIQRLAAGPRHRGARCPSCGESPPEGLVFRCVNDHLYDAFGTQGRCPDCGETIDVVRCIFCAEDHPTEAYAKSAAMS